LKSLPLVAVVVAVKELSVAVAVLVDLDFIAETLLLELTLSPSVAVVGHR
jgi:hypothetical protein